MGRLIQRIERAHFIDGSRRFNAQFLSVDEFMFYFYSDKTGVLESDENGVRLRTKRLFPGLRSAQEKSHRRILVIDENALPRTPTGTKVSEKSLYEALEKKNKKVVVVPLEAVRNLSPYALPLELEAGGGVVTRIKNDRLQVLLIFRKGVWDLPKGKQDKGETVEACALREVKEELGIINLRIIKSLDVTVHVYSENRRFKVKTTHWYQMATKETKFKPEKREGISKVKWVPWRDAEKIVGYKNLKKLLRRLKPNLY